MPVPLRDVNALPFELWREDGVIRLVLTRGAHVDIPMMKELLRVLGAVDPSGRAPVLLEQEERAAFDERARELLRRSCQQPGRPVALMAYDVAGRVQGEMLARYYGTRFPLRAFAWKDEALRWIEGWVRSPQLRVVP